MAATPAQQSWVPYGSTKDCSMGFCSIYCPQWCYVVFPPPPPMFDDESSGPTLSPIVIAVIGILASAFLLLGYYAIVSRYCGAFDSLRNRGHGPAGEAGRQHTGGGGSRRDEELWEPIPADGMEEALINKITVYKYKRTDGIVDGTDCSVCLGEFKEDEGLRVLPRCSHAFHLQCIDTWLKSHYNCPLCRASIHWPVWNPPPAAQLPPPQVASRAPAAPDRRRHGEIVLDIDDPVVGGEEEDDHHRPPNGGVAPKDSSRIRRSSGGPEDSNAVEPVRRSFSVDSSAPGRMSMGEVLPPGAEDELTAAGAAAGPSGREHGKDSSRNRGLAGPVPMKRSPSSSGRFCLTMNGKGRSSSNPPA